MHRSSAAVCKIDLGINNISRHQSNNDGWMFVSLFQSEHDFQPLHSEGLRMAI